MYECRQDVLNGFVISMECKTVQYPLNDEVYVHFMRKFGMDICGFMKVSVISATC